MVEFSLAGVVPSKKNNRRLFYARGRQQNIPSAAFEAWRQLNEIELRKQCRGIDMPIQSAPVFIGYVFSMPDLKRRDISNMIQGIEDLLVEIGLIVDDAWSYIQIVGAYAMLDPENVGVRFVIDDEIKYVKKWLDNNISYG